ncbi:DUF2637 domain-containing protein [Streptosporangium amethystogenes subsp. fukuiense]|uniref:DUF2637 domain-containing protein n=1 Tax=Streptosporangium amethystogenes subsp. fukuiense TaxID=698418 RepID=A0ABW2TF74_9ACTN
MTLNHDQEESAGVSRQGRVRRVLITTIAVTLGVVVLAPIALSSGHIFTWAKAPAPEGLALAPPMAVAAFVALDLAAVVCIAMTIYSSIRGEGAGVFGLLTWVFAAGSAYINWSTADTTLAGQFFASMSIAGPVLLEATLAKLRRWTRQEEGTQMSARPRFGGRWLPGVAFRETLAAWATARRENLAKPEDAIAHVRERRALSGMDDVDAIRYAWSALGAYDEYSARIWLQARGRTVTQAAMDTAVGDRPRTPLTAVQAPRLPALPAAPAVPEADPQDAPEDPYAADREVLSTLPSKRDMIRHAFSVTGAWDVPAVVEWLRVRGVTVSRADAYAVRKDAQDKGRAATLRAVGPS